MKHVLVVTENVIQGLLEKGGDKDTQATLNQLLLSMLTLAKHEYTVIAERGLSMVHSLLSKVLYLLVLGFFFYIFVSLPFL